MFARACELVRNLYQSVVLCLVTLAALSIAGCGGGGGGGGSGSGAPSPSSGLTVDKSSLTFTAEEGALPADQTVSGSIINATSSVYVTIAYTNNSLANVVYLQTGATTGSIRVVPKSSAEVGAGTKQDTITVQACYDPSCTQPVAGSPKQISVSYTVSSAHPSAALEVSDLGVAFGAVPSGSHLTRSIVVRDTSSTPAGWLASGSQAWLSVTPSGNSGGTLSLSADPTGLSDGFYEAAVTVNSAGSSIAHAETIRVGLYVSSTSSVSQFANPISDKTALDPIRPLRYSKSTTADGHIAVDHLYTGQRVGDINLGTMSLGSFAVSSDGSYLYAVDGNNQVITVNLDTQAVVGSYGFPQWSYNVSGPLSGARPYFLRIGQVSALLFDTVWTDHIFSPIVDAGTGAVLGELPSNSQLPSPVAVSRDSHVIYNSITGTVAAPNGVKVQRIELNRNSLGNIYGVKTAEWNWANSSNGVLSYMFDIATNVDGSRVFFCSNSDYGVRALAYANKVLAESSSPPEFAYLSGHNNGALSACQIDIGADNRLAMGFGGMNLRLYSSTEQLVQEWLAPPAIEIIQYWIRDLQISADGLRLIGGQQLMDLPQ